MKSLLFCLLFISIISCKSKPVVAESFVDSLIGNYTPSTAAITNEKDLKFWESRVDTMPELVNLQKFASALATRFHIYGDIRDLKKADSILTQISFQYKEPGQLLSLASYKMLQHQFMDAKTLIDSVIQMKAEKYATQMMSFDANFELGDIYHASMILRKSYAPKDFAYNFRLSKQDHYKGELKEAISHMLAAADLSGSSAYLRSAALSNAADLYVHNGALAEAAKLYEECIRFNSTDFHSITGLGWIALVHDNNEPLARKIFSFVRTKSKSPDPLLKLSQSFEGSDSGAAKRYAREFVQEATKPIYGNMYNKYLVQLYTGVLNDPASALSIAQKEIGSRATPQTYAWLTWCLYKNGKNREASQVYKNHVSGKALEALELFWMGKMMKGLGKGYNAQQFFKAAKKNEFDLGVRDRRELDGLLE